MKKTLKLILLITVLILGYFTIKAANITNISPDKIKTFILSFGWKAPIVYIFLYTIRPLFLFPASLLSLSGGLTFGPLRGTLYDIIGASLGAYISFFISRKLGMEAIQKVTSNKFKKVDYQMEAHGFRSILFVRLIPLFPFDAISYTAGISKIKFKDFALGTTLGLIPGSLVYNYLGHSLNNIFSLQFFIALSVLVLFMIIPLFYKILIKK